MKTVTPFGELNTAKILVVGHDPRLQQSAAEALYPFFFEYLQSSSLPDQSFPAARPENRAAAAKYDLALALIDYIRFLTAYPVESADLYLTNLCNQFLPRPAARGTILIPDDIAESGVADLARTVAHGNFQVIVPMSQQVFYQLCRLGFVEGQQERRQSFQERARPKPDRAAVGIYSPARPAAFLDVCGEVFYHDRVPVVPVVHVKLWPLRKSARRYTRPMQNAQQHIQSFLATAAIERAKQRLASSDEPREADAEDSPLRVLLTVHEQHKRGYHRVRIAPGISPSGGYWRCLVTHKGNILQSNGAHIAVWNDDELAIYTTGQRDEFFAWKDARDDTPQELADKFIKRFPNIASKGQGEDWPYVGWYMLMLNLARRDHLPYAFADWLTEPDWAWLPMTGDEKVRLPMPPPGEALVQADRTIEE